MLSPILSPSKEHSTPVGPNLINPIQHPQQYSSTSKLNSLVDPSSSPRLTRRARKISRSSEDVAHAHNSEIPAGFRNVGSKFLEVVESASHGGSIQKDLDVATAVLEGGAVETAAIIEKGVLNPFSKLTKGLGAVLKGQSEMTTGAMSDNALEALDTIPSPVRSTSQNNQVANHLLQMKIADANSQTKVLLI